MGVAVVMPVFMRLGVIVVMAFGGAQVGGLRAKEGVAAAARRLIGFPLGGFGFHHAHRLTQPTLNHYTRSRDRDLLA
jgi:hypothetical protein